eukprot:1354656-Rhodomonas_salina.1
MGIAHGCDRTRLPDHGTDAGHGETRVGVQIMMLVEITRAGQPDMPCFTSRAVLDELHQRFRLNMSKVRHRVKRAER